MASYHLAGQIFRRSAGHSAVAAAAYRARTELVDERTGLEHSYTGISKDLVFEGMFTEKNMPAWTRDRSKVWNRIEQVETYKNAQLAHELNIALPHELTDEAKKRALQDFAREFTRKGYVVDIAIHRAHDWGDARNDHAHVMIPLRKIERGANDFSQTKDRYSLAELSAQMDTWRERWAHHANRQLERDGHEVRIDHRSLEDQGIDRVATVHLGKEAAAMERQGIATDRGDHNRHAQLVNADRDRIEAEIAELKRLYELEDEQKAEIAQRLSGWSRGRAFQKEATAHEVESAVERQQREEREEQAQAIKEAEQDERRAAYKPNHPHRGIVAAMWSLARTSGASLAHVLLGADVADLVRGRRIETGLNKPDKRQTQEVKWIDRPTSQVEEKQPRAFVDRGNKPAPYRALVSGMRQRDPEERSEQQAGIDATRAAIADYLEKTRQEAEAHIAAGDVTATWSSVAPAAPRIQRPMVVQDPIAPDPLEAIRREQQERFRQVARENPRRDVSRELEDDLEL